MVFSGSNTLENQECYLLWGFTINLIFKGEKIVGNLIAKIAYKEVSLLTKKIFRILLFKFLRKNDHFTNFPSLSKK